MLKSKLTIRSSFAEDSAAYDCAASFNLLKGSTSNASSSGSVLVTALADAAINKGKWSSQVKEEHHVGRSIWRASSLDAHLGHIPLWI